MKRTRLSLFGLAALLLATGCTQRDPEGYHVASFEPPDKWVIIRNGTFDGKYLRKRMTVRCISSRIGDERANIGDSACYLRVGDVLLPNHGKSTGPGSADIIETGDGLTITKGTGSSALAQQFVILNNEVIPE